MKPIDGYVIAGICLISSGHEIGGSVCLFVAVLLWRYLP